MKTITALALTLLLAVSVSAGQRAYYDRDGRRIGYENDNRYYDRDGRMEYQRGSHDRNHETWYDRDGRRAWEEDEDN